MPSVDEYEELSIRANALADRGRIEEARGLLKQGLGQAQEAGDESFVLFFQGELAYWEGRREAALDLETQASGLRPDCPLFMRNIGSILANLGRRNEAFDWFQQALAVRADDAVTLAQGGANLVDLGRFQQAADWLERALKIQPEDPAALTSYAFVLGNMQEFAKAMEFYERALEVEPGYPDAELLRAVTIGMMGDEKGAADSLGEYLRKHPDEPRARHWLIRFVGRDDAQAIIREIEEEELRRWQEAREREIRLDAWRRLSGRASHRIGNQIFAARGSLRTLGKLEEPDAAEAVRDLEGCLARVRRIVQEFSTFSTNEQPRLRKVDPGQLIRDIARRYDRLAHDTEVTAEAPEDLPVCLLDADQMDQAVGELLENAIHYTPAGGRIRVSAEPLALDVSRRPWVRIILEDMGKGVPRRDKERIFEAFVTTKPGGSGLGLAIVRQIVENHGGSIRETGEPGKGARFEIRLPATPPTENEP
ncbi:MAG: ATP-binding protein [Candidatus Brocadiia bacterium]